MIRCLMDYGLLTATGDLEAHGKRIQECGANCVRFVLNYLHDDNAIPNPLTPYVRIGTWNPGAMGASADYNRDFPMYDLAQRNQDFIDRLAVIASWMKRYGLIPWICFDDQCSEPVSYVDAAGNLVTQDEWKSMNDCYTSCRQRFPNWQTSIEHVGSNGNKDMALNPYREQLERDVYSLFRAVGFTEIYGEVENEYGYTVTPGCLFPVEAQLDWYATRAANLKGIGYKVIGSARDPITTKIVPYVDIYDAHNIRNATDSDYALGITEPARTILNTDGAMGDAPEESIFGGHSVSVEQAKSIGSSAAVHSAAGFCYLSQLTFKEVICTDLDSTEYPQLEAMSLASGWEKPKPPEPPVEHVTLRTCNANPFQYLANEYCPATNEVSFIKGSEPTAVCSIHTKPDEEDTVIDKLKAIWNWLFGPNSLWTKYPHLTGFAMGFLAGLLAVAIL